MDQVQTWASGCDHIYAFSDELFRVPELNFSTIALQPPEIAGSYSAIWQKYQLMYAKVLEAWSRDSLEFLAVGGDDTVFIMDNLKAYLASAEFQMSAHNGSIIALGRSYPPRYSWIGGGGYVLNRAAINAILTCDPRIRNTKTAAEDVMMSRCLERAGYTRTAESTTDADGNNLFSCCDYLSQSKLARGISKFHIQLHYMYGEQLFEFYDALYGSDGRFRLCVESLDDDDSGSNNTLRLSEHQAVDLQPEGPRQM